MNQTDVKLDGVDKLLGDMKSMLGQISGIASSLSAEDKARLDSELAKANLDPNNEIPNIMANIADARTQLDEIAKKCR